MKLNVVQHFSFNVYLISFRRWIILNQIIYLFKSTQLRVKGSYSRRSKCLQKEEQNDEPFTLMVPSRAASLLS